MDIDSTKLTVFLRLHSGSEYLNVLREESFQCVKSCLVQNQRTMKSGSICSRIIVGCASVHLLRQL